MENNRKRRREQRRACFFPRDYMYKAHQNSKPFCKGKSNSNDIWTGKLIVDDHWTANAKEAGWGSKWQTAHTSMWQEIAVTFLVPVSEHHPIWQLSPSLVPSAGSESNSIEHGHYFMCVAGGIQWTGTPQFQVLFSWAGKGSLSSDDWPPFWCLGKRVLFVPNPLCKALHSKCFLFCAISLDSAVADGQGTTVKQTGLGGSDEPMYISVLLDSIISTLSRRVRWAATANKKEPSKPIIRSVGLSSSRAARESVLTYSITRPTIPGLLRVCIPRPTRKFYSRLPPRFSDFPHMTGVPGSSVRLVVEIDAFQDHVIQLRLQQIGRSQNPYLIAFLVYFPSNSPLWMVDSSKYGYPCLIRPI